MGTFDCHLHVEKGLDRYPIPLSGANVIFNSVGSYLEHKGAYPNFFHSLIFDYKNYPDVVSDAITSGDIRALKIHSRVQRIQDSDYDAIFESLKRQNNDIPIIYDAFYYGHELIYQPNLDRLIQLAVLFPARRIIVAHSGGHHVLDYFFHLRELRNVGFDLSFSLQYLQGTSVLTDLMKLLQYTDSRRIFWGSDFPHADPKAQIDSLLIMLDKIGYTSGQMEDVCQTNWIDFTERS